MPHRETLEIMKFLNHPDPEVRRTSIEKVDTEQIDVELLRLLVHKLEDENKGVRDAAFQVLKKVSHDSLPRLLSPFFYYRDLEIKNLAVDLMVSLGENAVTELIEILHTTDPDAQKSAAEVLNIIQSHRAVDALIEHLEDPDPNVIFACIEALGSIGDYKAVMPLLRVFRENEDLRGVAVEALGKILSRKIPTEFLEALREDDPVLVFSVIEAMGKIKDPAALDYLIEIYPKHEDIVREEILKSMAQIVEESDYFLVPTWFFPVLTEKIQESDDEGNSKHYLTLLSKIGKKEVLPYLFMGYGRSNDQSWQNFIFRRIINFYRLFPEKVIQAVEEAEDDEYRYHLIMHMPYSSLREYYQWLEQFAEQSVSEDWKKTIMYARLLFPIPEARDEIRSIISDPQSPHHDLVLEFFKQQPFAEFVDQIIQVLPDLEESLQVEYMKLLSQTNNSIPDETLESLEPKLSSECKPFIIPMKKHLTDDDLIYIRRCLAGNSEEKQLALEILEKIPSAPYFEELEQLAQCSEWSVLTRVAQIYITNYNDSLKQRFEKFLSHMDFVRILLTEMGNAGLFWTNEYWMDLVGKIPVSLARDFLRYFLKFPDDQKFLFKKLMPTVDSSLQKEFLSELQEEGEYDLIRWILEEKVVNEEVGSDFSRMIQEM